MNNDNELSYQKDKIINYFRKSEKRKEDFKIGAEFEHFIVNKDTLETITYYDNKGVESTLKDLLNKGWKGKYEDGYLMGLTKNGNNITLEPGAQVELSTRPCNNIKEIEREYLSFLNDIIPILNNKNQFIIALGYHPQSKIEEIPFIPKGRYKYMSEYFKKRGRLAHNMMKGTASFQITMDYRSEEDYIKKFRVANVLSPIISYMFDNTPFFEGEVWNKNILRVHVWNNCDDDRCMVVPGSLDKSFGYEDYADYLLSTPPIIIKRNNEFQFTDNKPFKDIYYPDNFSKEELEHVMTMYFPDVRTKNFIEIRMADSVPYPLNMAGIALWKGLLYDVENLNGLYKRFSSFTNSTVKDLKEDIIKYGKNTVIGNQGLISVCKDIICMAEKGLELEEAKYLLPLKELLNKEMTPSLEIKNKLHLGKHSALNKCILNNILLRK